MFSERARILNSTEVFDTWLQESGYEETIRILDPEDQMVVFARVANNCDSILERYNNTKEEQNKILEDWEKCANGEIKSDFLTSKLSEIIEEQRENIKQLRNDNDALLQKLDSAQKQISELKNDNERQIADLKNENEKQFQTGLGIAVSLFIAGIAFDHYILPKLRNLSKQN